MINFLIMFGCGVIGLVLAVQCAVGFTATNWPALLLIPPGAMPFIPFVVPALQSAKRLYPDPEILEKQASLPAFASARLFVGFTIWLTLLIAMVFAVFALVQFWLPTLRNVLWSGTRYHATGLLWAAWSAVTPSRHGAFMILGIFLLIIFSGAWSFLTEAWRKQSVRLRKAWGLPVLTDEDRDLAQSRLRALWDYANDPMQPPRNSARRFLAAIAGCTVYVGAIVLLATGDRIVDWLVPPSRFFAGQNWYYFVRDDRAIMVAPFVALLFSSMAVYRLVIDLWPRALQAELVAGLRQGGNFKFAQIDALRRALGKDILRRRAELFDPRRFLLRRRLRISRRIYVATILLLAMSAAAGWYAARIGTLFTDKGVVMRDLFRSWESTYSYRDVTKVRLQCMPVRVNSYRAEYGIVFKDGSRIGLLVSPGSPQNVDAIAHIDEQLRHAGAKFILYVDQDLMVRGTRRCVNALAGNARQAGVLARIMHLTDLKR
jgi:hypothetical protein